MSPAIVQGFTTVLGCLVTLAMLDSAGVYPPKRLITFIAKVTA